MEAVEGACRAVLEIVGERMPEGLAGNLAAQLPHEVGEHLRRTDVHGGTRSGERFGRQDFIARVAERAGVGEPQAAFIARAVAEVADEAVQGRLMTKVAESLPEGIRQLVRFPGRRPDRLQALSGRFRALQLGDRRPGRAG